MGPVRIRLAATIAVGIAVACTTFGSTDGARPGGPPADGGRADEPDGGSDAAAFCTGSAGHELCADFSRPPVTAGWNPDRYSETGGGTITLDGDDWTSSPSSLAAHLPPYTPEQDDSGVGGGRARLCRTVVAASRLRLAFSMKVLAIDPATKIGFASLRFNYARPTGQPADQTLYVDVVTDSAAWAVEQSNNKVGPDVLVPIVPAQAQGVWTRVELAAELRPGNEGVSAHTTVVIDGKAAAEHSKDWPAPDGVDSEVCIGITFVGRSTAPIRVLYDDVILDVTPR